jgi:hypothetical protein
MKDAAAMITVCLMLSLLRDSMPRTLSAHPFPRIHLDTGDEEV